jgi:hypothetical protein
MYGLPNFIRHIKCKASRQFLAGFVHIQTPYSKYRLEFRGLITIVDIVITYRDPPGGRTLISTEQVDVKPLGFVREVGTVIITEIPNL